MFIDVSGLEPGSGPWLIGQIADTAMLLGLPLMVGGLVAALAALWVDRRRG